MEKSDGNFPHAANLDHMTSLGGQPCDAIGFKMATRRKFKTQHDLICI